MPCRGIVRRIFLLRYLRSQCVSHKFYCSVSSRSAFVTIFLWLNLAHAASPLNNLAQNQPLIPTDTSDFARFIGGELNDAVHAITRDAVGNIYLTGETNSTIFEGNTFTSPTANFSLNCFVMRINPQSAEKNYVYILNGKRNEICRAITVDAAGQAYVTGETQSDDLPVTNQTRLRGDWDAFVLKINVEGKLLYASYLGGSNTDYGHGIAVASEDNVYVVGETWSSDFPTTTNALTPDCNANFLCASGKANAYVIHLNTEVANVWRSNYSSYLGGNAADKAHSIAIDPAGILHIAGETASEDFPRLNTISTSLAGGFDGFLVKLNPVLSGSDGLVVSTTFGGQENDFIAAVGADAAGNSYITGETLSDNFPTSDNAFSRQCAAGTRPCVSATTQTRHSDVFIAKISYSPHATITYSSLFGGRADDTASTIALNPKGEIVVAGVTHSNDFPLTNNALRHDCNSEKNCQQYSDGFLLQVNPAMSSVDSLQYASYVGGNAEDRISALSVNENVIYVAGKTYSDDIMTGLYFNSAAGDGDGFIQKITVNEYGRWLKPGPDNSVARNHSGAVSWWFLLLCVGRFLLRPKFI